MAAVADGRMNIGEAAKATGVSAKMIRHYERIGLVRPSARRESGYRDLDERDVAELRFIGRSRGLGFTLETIAQLLDLWRDQARPSREVKAIVDQQLTELQDRIRGLEEIASTLRRLADACAGDERPDCPILAELASFPERGA